MLEQESTDLIGDSSSHPDQVARSVVWGWPH